MTRRQALSLPFAAIAARAQSQNRGMASRNVQALPRGKPSGLPFHAHFTDIAAAAGLPRPRRLRRRWRHRLHPRIHGLRRRLLRLRQRWLAGHLRPDRRRWSDTPAGATIRLYHNNRDGTFTDVTEKAGLARTGWASGVTVGDYDNDGFEDIFITYWGQNILFHNNGNGTFTDVTKRPACCTPASAAAPAVPAIDYDRDGHLDLFVAHYVDLRRREFRSPAARILVHYQAFPSSAARAACRKNAAASITTTATALHRRQRHIRHLAGRNRLSLSPPSRPISMAMAGPISTSPAIPRRVCFFHNNHDGTFTERGSRTGVALTKMARCKQAWVSPSATSISMATSTSSKPTSRDDTNVLYLNDGKGNFEVTSRAGLGVETRYRRLGRRHCGSG